MKLSSSCYIFCVDHIGKNCTLTIVCVCVWGGGVGGWVCVCVFGCVCLFLSLLDFVISFFLLAWNYSSFMFLGFPHLLPMIICCLMCLFVSFFHPPFFSPSLFVCICICLFFCFFVCFLMSRKWIVVGWVRNFMTLYALLHVNRIVYSSKESHRCEG